jgi:DNA mismatch repair protein MLH1
VKHENGELRFRLSGFITNANYNTKKPTFVLFINHRSVHSSNLKKAIDEGVPGPLRPKFLLAVEEGHRPGQGDGRSDG